MVEQVDTGDLKSPDENRAGSIPALGINDRGYALKKEAIMRITPALPSGLEQLDGTIHGTIMGLLSLLKTLRDDENVDRAIETLSPTLFLLDFLTEDIEIKDYVSSNYVPHKDGLSVALKMSDPVGLVGDPSSWHSQIASSVEKSGSRGYALIFVSSTDTDASLKLCISVSVDGFCKSFMVDTDLESNQKEFDIKDVHESLKPQGH